MDWFNIISNAFGIASAILAFIAAWQAYQLRRENAQERARKSKKVTVKLQYGGKDIELPVELQRAELSRAELLGRIGMIPMKQKGSRFALGYLNTPEFLRQLNQVITTDGDAILTISCDKSEFDQFDIKP